MPTAFSRLIVGETISVGVNAMSRADESSALCRGELSVNDQVWQMARDMMARHAIGQDECAECRQAQPCPRICLARTGLELVLGLPTNDADAAYWVGLVKARTAQQSTLSNLADAR